MALFQKSVLKKHINDIPNELLQNAWQQFQLHFHNNTKQQNIRNSKEEQYQEGFLRELFADVLGYTLNPQSNFNLTTEYKNEKDSKKADGAILNGEQVVAVIELKGTETTDLAKVEVQAFNYKNNQKGCTYIITSNFEKLRLYINDATDFEEFNLFTLSYERFALMYLCLQKNNLLAHIPLHIKQASLAAEENVTRKLYADYSTFKKKLYHNIVALNPQFDKLILFKKTQKLLDRFLFIFFAEDRLLLPPNSVREILKQWQQLTELDNYVPLYDRFKKYFGYLNVGHKGKLYEIFAYNGGLFANDEVLETIIIDDDTLYQSCITISNYDFDTEVDVNILGHIFEHSLNEIEELQAELEGTTIDKTKTKRKKDGVFYTPRYITKYIVENTVGSLCNAKKAELNIVDDEFTTEKRKANKKKLLEQLDIYRQWLLQLTICDPACGSGAFLNQALDFLLAEHKYVDELKANLFGDSIVYSDVEKEILENNLFGVDINEEAVEIARLSLWLRTAHKGRKLNNLSNNIKCGNSLIDDITVAGEKAFNWHKEFQQVFTPKDKRAFHVVLTTHNSRTSQRMKLYNVVKGEALELNLEQEIILAQIVKDIVVENNYNCLAFNICKDHAHVILVCTEEELNNVVKIIKGKSAYLFNRHTYNSNGLKPIGSIKPIGDIEPTGNIEPIENIESIENTPPIVHIEPIENIDTNHSKGFQPLEYTESNAFQSLVNNKHIHHGHLWSQKFFRAYLDEVEVAELSNKPGWLYNDSYVINAINYVKGNREKHGLPFSQQLNKIIDSFCVDIDTAYATENKGGFDVIIGNPPYVRAELLGDYKEHFKSKYKVFNSASDLFAFFYEKAFLLLKTNGKLGFISNTFNKTSAAKELRQYLTDNISFESYVDFTEVQIFEGATTYPVILIATNKPSVTENDFDYFKIKKENISSINLYTPIIVKQGLLNNINWSFASVNSNDIINKILLHPVITKGYNKSYRGLITGLNEAFIMPKNTFPKSVFIKEIYEGKDLEKWSTPKPNQELILFKSKYTKTTFGNLSEQDAFAKIKDAAPEISNHLILFEENAKKRYDKGEYWWELRNCAYYHLFDQPKIVFPNLQNSNKFCFDEEGIFVNAPAVFISLAHLENYKEEGLYLLAILNSKVIWYFLQSICVVRNGGYIEVKPQYVEQIPIPNFNAITSKPLSNKAFEIIESTKKLQKAQSSFLNLLQSKFEQLQLNKKLNSWHSLTFGAFIKELEKQKIKLALQEQAEWMPFFEAEKQKVLAIIETINATDKAIDAMVYTLYNLTEDEIKIIEDA